jgi:hypothetical protein
VGRVVVTASSPIKFFWLQPLLDGDVEKFVGVVWFLRTSSGCGIFGSLRSFIGGSSFFFVFGIDVAFWAHSM